MNANARETRANDAPADVTGLGTTLLAMFRTRLDLFQEELQEERDDMLAQLRLTVIGGAAAFLTAIAAILWVGLALPPEYRLVVLGGLTLALAAIVAWTVRLRSRLRSEAGRPFRRLLAQLARDGEVVSGNVPGSPQ